MSSAVASVSGTETTSSPWSAAIWPQLPADDEVGRLEPEAEPEHAVARGGGAAALDVAEHGRARLHAGAALDLLRDGLADVAVLDADVAEVVDLALVARRRAARAPSLATITEKFFPRARRRSTAAATSS